MKRYQLYSQLLSRVREPRRFIQVLAGPRQVGKTTLARQVMEASGLPAHYASADEPTLRDQAWLEQQWDLARLKARNHPEGALLVIDEIQKAARWPEVVKLLWDADMRDALGLPLVYCDDLHGYRYDGDVSDFPVFDISSEELATLFFTRTALQGIRGTRLG
jgi:hypothetical protein